MTGKIWIGAVNKDLPILGMMITTGGFIEVWFYLTVDMVCILPHYFGHLDT